MVTPSNSHYGARTSGRFSFRQQEAQEIARKRSGCRTMKRDKSRAPGQNENCWVTPARGVSTIARGFRRAVTSSSSDRDGARKVRERRRSINLNPVTSTADSLPRHSISAVSGIVAPSHPANAVFSTPDSYAICLWPLSLQTSALQAPKNDCKATAGFFPAVAR